MLRLEGNLQGHQDLSLNPQMIENCIHSPVVPLVTSSVHGVMTCNMTPGQKLLERGSSVEISFLAQNSSALEIENVHSFQASHPWVAFWGQSRAFWVMPQSAVMSDGKMSCLVDSSVRMVQTQWKDSLHFAVYQVQSQPKPQENVPQNHILARRIEGMNCID